MDPHPDFADSDVPRRAEFGGFVLAPLTPAETEEDFHAVIESTAVLTGLFNSDWPKGLTLEDNRIDLSWHDREFRAKRSFAWIIRDQNGAYLGCAYLYPDIGKCGSGAAVTWMREMPGWSETLLRFNADFRSWIAEYLPAHYDLRWVTQKYVS